MGEISSALSVRAYLKCKAVNSAISTMTEIPYDSILSV